MAVRAHDGTVRAFRNACRHRGAYLHYSLDKWFQEVVKAHVKGEACLIRYADDFVCAFEYEQDAQAFYTALRNRTTKLPTAADYLPATHRR
jgi:hypothetical protein